MESTVKTMTIKGVPDALYRELKHRAKTNRRSLNAEVLVRLELAIPLRRRNREDLSARLTAVREELRVPYLSDAAIRAAIRTGRA